MFDVYIYTFYNETKYWILKEKEEIFKLEVNQIQISENFYDLFEQSGIDFKDIKTLTFINGPGSFTSLRFFLTFAKALKVSSPDVQIIPLNMLELIAFSKLGTHDVIMGGSREFLKFFHHGIYKRTEESFKILQDVKLISYDEASNIKNPLFLGVKPNFEVKEYNINLKDMMAFSEYKLKNNQIDNILSLTPYYYKQFVTKKV